MSVVLRIEKHPENTKQAIVTATTPALYGALLGQVGAIDGAEVSAFEARNDAVQVHPGSMAVSVCVRALDAAPPYELGAAKIADHTGVIRRVFMP